MCILRSFNKQKKEAVNATYSGLSINASIAIFFFKKNLEKK